MMIEVVYRFPAPLNPERQAQMIAVGQTAGSWSERHAHREAQLRGHLGQVMGVETRRDGSHLARVGFPVANTEGDIASLLTMIFGKYSLAGPCRVMDLRLPEDYGTPAKYGIAGLRRLTGVADRPLFMAIYKPALGLSAADHAALLAEVAPAGLDLIKDDEILGDLPEAPTLARVRACRPVIEEARRATGREILYAVNLTGRADRLLARARALVSEGANALLLNAYTYGFPILEALAADPAVTVPIFTHPALAGALGGPTASTADYGIDYAVLLGTLMRHAGADAVLYPAHYGSLPFAAHTEMRIRDLLRGPRGDRPPVMPVPSAGIHPGVMSRCLHDYGADVVLNAGTAIFDHPMGPAAGVQAFFEALEAVRRGLPLRADTISPGPLRAALQKWGSVA